MQSWYTVSGTSYTFGTLDTGDTDMKHNTDIWAEYGCTDEFYESQRDTWSIWDSVTDETVATYGSEAEAVEACMYLESTNTDPCTRYYIV